ncbi:MAG TPA: hypothetical protein VIT00_03190, partial [Terrimicrobiaceae bacterium]
GRAAGGEPTEIRSAGEPPQRSTARTSPREKADREPERVLCVDPLRPAIQDGLDIRKPVMVLPVTFLCTILGLPTPPVSEEARQLTSPSSC